MSVSPSDVQNLEIQAVVFATMTAMSGASFYDLPLSVHRQWLTLLALYIGVYFVLFLLALASTFRQAEQSYKNLRIVTLAL